MKKYLLIGLLLVPMMLPAASVASLLAKAKKAESKGATEKAIPLFEKAAGMGSVEASVWLWQYYMEPTHLNMVKTQNYMRKAALAGDAASAYRLGQIYEKGENLMTDYAKAVQFYTIASEKGMKEAQYRLGMLYAAGRGVKQDLSQTIYWYTKAAEQGYFDAQAQLATMYKKGIGVEADQQKAAYWAEKVQDYLKNHK